MRSLSFVSNYHITNLIHFVNKSKLLLRIKALLFNLKNKGGRVKGRIIMPRRGNYNRRLYRCIDFNRNRITGHEGLVLCFTYDSNRSTNLCVLCYSIGVFNYILRPDKLQIGDTVLNYTENPQNPGDSASLLNIPSGKIIHNIHGKYTRAAGCTTILVRKDNEQVLVKLKSGELRFFHNSIIASLGSLGNENHFLRHYKRAGVMRHLGKRPRTRPTSMNPVDHPMGGRTRGGSQPVNKKGILTLGRKTVFQHHPNILYTKRQLKFLHQ